MRSAGTRWQGDSGGKSEGPQANEICGPKPRGTLTLYLQYPLGPA
jgi:hypothetical protein